MCIYRRAARFLFCRHQVPLSELKPEQFPRVEECAQQVAKRREAEAAAWDEYQAAKDKTPTLENSVPVVRKPVKLRPCSVVQIVDAAGLLEGNDEDRLCCDECKARVEEIWTVWRQQYNEFMLFDGSSSRSSTQPASNLPRALVPSENDQTRVYKAWNKTYDDYIDVIIYYGMFDWFKEWTKDLIRRVVQKEDIMKWVDFEMFKRLQEGGFND